MVVWDKRSVPYLPCAQLRRRHLIIISKSRADRNEHIMLPYYEQNNFSEFDTWFDSIIQARIDTCTALQLFLFKCELVCTRHYTVFGSFQRLLRSFSRETKRLRPFLPRQANDVCFSLKINKSEKYRDRHKSVMI